MDRQLRERRLGGGERRLSAPRVRARRGAAVSDIAEPQVARSGYQWVETCDVPPTAATQLACVGTRGRHSQRAESRR